MKKTLIGVLAAVAVLATTVSPAGAHHRSQPENVVAAVIGASGEPGTFDNRSRDYDLLREAVIAGGLVDALVAADGITVFAPNDRAFMRLARSLGWDGKGEADAFAFIAENVPSDLLVAVLTYHVVPDTLKWRDILSRQSVGTLQGNEIEIRYGRLGDQDPDFKDPRVIWPKISTGNGVIYTIDRVLLPADI